MRLPLVDVWWRLGAHSRFLPAEGRQDNKYRAERMSFLSSGVDTVFRKWFAVRDVRCRGDSVPDIKKGDTLVPSSSVPPLR